MEYKELPPVCRLCEGALTSPWYNLRAYRFEGFKVKANFHFLLCQACYTPVHTAVKKAVHERMKQLFQEALAYFKQDVQKSVEKIGKQP
jgi:hypothetical protein